MRAKRTDRNQTEIIRALRKAGCTVQSLATVGAGTPDLLVGRAGWNFCLEVKDENQPPSRKLLTPDEHLWHRTWAGQVSTVENVEQALKAVGLI